MAEPGAPVIIKKIKKGGGHGHHGGAWKVAYADFVTAMMAFFLLLWLLSSTSEEQRQGLADYFTPTTLSNSTNSGAGGMLGGQSVASEGAAMSNLATFGVTVTLPSTTDPDEEQLDPDPDSLKKRREAGEDTDEEALDPEQLKTEALRKEIEARQDEAFSEAMEELRYAISSNPELAALAENVIMDVTAEGLRIQLVDQHGTSMFPSGSADMFGRTTEMIKQVVDAISHLENDISLKGHTDATPFRSADGRYTNWELSTDRAHASRRAMVEAGLDSGRITQVVGKADTEPFVKDDPTSPQNRRISIILLRDELPPAAKPAKKEAPQLPPPSIHNSDG
ncbi:flagellar motor protein MotB [Rhodovibrionaceae bacterium A322]